MALEDKLWRWYERHSHAVNTVLEIAQDIIPGGKIVFHALKATHAFLHDREENAKEKDIQELQDMMVQIKPELSDIVEEIEQHPEYQKASTEQDSQTLCKVVERNFGNELNEVISKISPIVSMSAKRIQSGSQNIPINRRIINQKYQVLRLLGSGGQGEVYEGIDVDADKRVAIKLLPLIFSQDPSAIATLRVEYNRVVDKLVHANIVQYRSMAQDIESGRWFLVMDYIPGSNLRKWLVEHRSNPSSFESALKFLEPIAQALDFAHQNKVVHCDLKPENILIREGDQKLFLADFGLAKEIHTTLSTKNIDNDISGTLPYMAPEQYLGRWPDEHTDIWALGIIVYEMVAGYHPFKGISFEHYKDLICREQPERPMNLKEKEWELLLKFLQKDRTRRPTQAGNSFATFFSTAQFPTMLQLTQPVTPNRPIQTVSFDQAVERAMAPKIDAQTLKELEDVRTELKLVKQGQQRPGCWSRFVGLSIGITSFPLIFIIMVIFSEQFVHSELDVSHFAVIFFLSILASSWLGSRIIKRIANKKM